MGLLELIEEPSGKQISPVILLLLRPLQTGNAYADICFFLLLICVSALTLLHDVNAILSKVYG